MNWRPVIGLEDLYEVSDQGNLRALERLVVTKNGVARHLPSRVLHPNVDSKDGYTHVILGSRKARKRILLHRIVWEAFRGEVPAGMVVRHLDGNPRNNALSNLAIGTQAENLHDCYEYGGKTGPGKLYRKDVEDIRARAARGESCKDISADYPVTTKTVERIKHRRLYPYIPNL